MRASVAYRRFGCTFEHRAGVDLDEMAGLVTLRVVGMGGVRHVGGSQHRRRQVAQVIFPPATRGEHDAFQDGAQQVGLRAMVGGRADLLIVEQGQHGQEARGPAASNASKPA